MFVQYIITLTPARPLPSEHWLGIPMDGFVYEQVKRSETVMVDFQRFTKPGFVGWCQFYVGKDLLPADRRQLFALLRMMPYTGIGYKTTMGMGMVSLNI